MAFGDWYRTHLALFWSLVIVVPVVVAVAVTVAVLYWPDKKPTAPSGDEPGSDTNPVGPGSPGAPNDKDLNVVFTDHADREADVGQSFTLALAANNDLSTYPSTTDFDPDAQSVKVIDKKTFSATFVFDHAEKLTVVLKQKTCKDVRGNENLEAAKSHEITVVQPNPPPPTPQAGQWEGVATTTVFGSGDGPWGSKTGFQISLDATNSEASNRMGAAVPWRVLCKQFGNKDTQCEQTVNSAEGKTDDKACWLVQPITKYFGQVNGSTDATFDTTLMNTMCTENCTDVNSDSIAATDKNGKAAPHYLLVGFEGCGGDCKAPAPDCVNSCAGVGTNIVDVVECDFGKCTGAECDGMKVVWDGGQWRWTDQISSDFLEHSQPYPISPETKWGKDTKSASGRLNWCSGQNMHFDLAVDAPYWDALGLNVAELNAPTNVMVRYQRVKCDVAGKFNPNPSGGGGGYLPCPSGFYDCGNLDCPGCTTQVLKPGDPEWPGSAQQTHACCKLA